MRVNGSDEENTVSRFFPMPTEYEQVCTCLAYYTLLTGACDNKRETICEQSKEGFCENVSSSKNIYKMVLFLKLLVQVFREYFQNHDNPNILLTISKNQDQLRKNYFSTF